MRCCYTEDAAVHTYIRIYIQRCYAYYMQRSHCLPYNMWAVSIGQCVPCAYIASNGIYHQCMCTVCVRVCCMCEAVPPQSLLHVRFSAQCVLASCDSHLHHSLQLMALHQVGALEGLVGGKERNTSCMYCLYSTIRMHKLVTWAGKAKLFNMYLLRMYIHH